jgi:hypothetical protein
MKSGSPGWMCAVGDGVEDASELVTVGTVEAVAVLSGDVLCRDAEDALDDPTTLLVDTELEDTPPGPAVKVPAEVDGPELPAEMLVKTDVAEVTDAVLVDRIGDTVSDLSTPDVEPCPSLVTDDPETEL